MAKDKKTLTTDDLIKKEKNRLKRLFKDIEVEKKKLAEELFSNASFLSVQMDILKNDINENGVTVPYQNGENQWGTKRSPSLEAYNSFLGHYTKIISQLNSLLPNDVPIVQETKVVFNKPK